VGFIQTFDLTYADHGTSSRIDLATYRANTHCPSFNWTRVGDFAQNNYDKPIQQRFVVLRATADDPDALVAPTSMTLNWNDKKGTSTHGSKDGGLYTPECPTGYVALGSVGVYADVLHVDVTPDNFPDLKCIKKSYTVALPSSSLTNIWTDHGSGCDLSGSVWTQPTVTDPNTEYVGHMPWFAGESDSYDAPTDKYTLDTSNPQISWFGDDPTCDPPAPTPAPSNSPEQVHLGFGYEPSSMSVQWTTNEACGAATNVQWALSEDAVASASVVKGDAFKFTIDAGRVWCNHVANMTGLAPTLAIFTVLEMLVLATGRKFSIFNLR
jgi:hypothetical protein